MPIDADALRDGDGLSVRPGTNEYALLAFLLQHRDLAYTPKELSDETDIPYGSVYPTLQRLEEKGFVEKVDRYWMAIDDDRIASKAASLVGLRTIAVREDEDEYSQHPDWATDLPDLGENA